MGHPAEVRDSMSRMLPPVPLAPKSLSDYPAVVGRDVVAALRERAEPFRGARVLHVNSTAFGGGVAELLYTLVPLMRDLGMDAEWRLIHGHEDFFNVTKTMHNALQGAEVGWTDEMEARYHEVNQENAEAFEGSYDFVFVHDSQPAGLLPHLLDGGAPRAGKWIWRCHIDLTEVFEPVWAFVKPLVERYDAAVFTLQDFVRPGLEVPHIALIPPSIDPLSLKNIPLEPDTCGAVIRDFGLDPARPLIVQVSRFDPWKDPLGVIDAYRMVKREMPEVQLAMTGSMAADDPEGFEFYEKTDAHRNGDTDIALLTNLQGVGNLEINAFQRSADVVLQKSLREGFGLTVAEAMWKSKPVIAGNVGGIRLQIEDGRSGFLVDSVEDCAKRTLELLANRDYANDVGRAGRSRVRERFLSTRHLDDFLTLFETLSR
jgi:trehalose synthase